MSAGRPRIAILGAGPVGLEAALAASEHRLPFTLYERADRVAANVRDWRHVRLFSPWEMNASPRARRFLFEAGHEVPEGHACPTGAELVEKLLEPLARLPAISGDLTLGTRVVKLARQGLLKHEAINDPERGARPFRLLLEDAGGVERTENADVVIDCTGSYEIPNALGDGGIPAPGEIGLDDLIVRRIPDLDRDGGDWAGRTILLVGAGHSAQTAARDLAELAAAEGDPATGRTRVVWAVRDGSPGADRIEDDPLPERARLAERATELAAGASTAVEMRTGVVVERLDRADGTGGDRVRVTLRSADGGTEIVEVDRILALTGSVGDHRIYRQLQVHECWATSGPMRLAAELLAASSADCLAQPKTGPEVLTSPEPGFFILGSKSYGRTSTFLMQTGWSQVDQVFELIG